MCQGLEMGVGLNLDYHAGSAGNLRGCLEGYRNGNSHVRGSDGSLNLGWQAEERREGSLSLGAQVGTSSVQ